MHRLHSFALTANNRRCLSSVYGAYISRIALSREERRARSTDYQKINVLLYSIQQTLSRIGLKRNMCLYTCLQSFSRIGNYSSLSDLLKSSCIRLSPCICQTITTHKPTDLLCNYILNYCYDISAGM